MTNYHAGKVCHYLACHSRYILVPAEFNPVENIEDVWQVDIDCTVPDTLRVSIEGESSRYELQELLEVRITCTDGSDQVSTV